MITLLYFSPTGGTRHVAMAMAEEFAKIHPINTICVNYPSAREKIYEFTDKDVLLIASPTYAGRIPNKIMPFFRDNLIGNAAACIPVVTFGNRSYDNSLLEMTRLMEANGFYLLGAGAFVTRHSMSGQLGKGRPNEDDLQEIKAFAQKMLEKINHKNDYPPIHLDGEVGPYYIPKKSNGEKAVFLKAKPVVDHDLCIKCGKCADSCPMGSISADMDYETVAICIKCHACLHICKEGARKFTDPDLNSHIKMLEENYLEQKCENVVISNA